MENDEYARRDEIKALAAIHRKQHKNTTPERQQEIEQRRKALFLKSTLETLSDYWLRLNCTKDGTVEYPLRLMVTKHGGHHLLRDILHRLRCKICRKKPTEVILMENNRRMECGTPIGWRVRLPL